jgi:hypothetical protein
MTGHLSTSTGSVAFKAHDEPLLPLAVLGGDASRRSLARISLDSIVVHSAARV